MKALPLTLPWKLSLVPATTALLLVVAVLTLSEALLGDYLAERAQVRVQQTAERVADLFGRALSRRAGEVQLLAHSEAALERLAIRTGLIDAAG